jgi:cell division transport system permease protein
VRIRLHIEEIAALVEVIKLVEVAQTAILRRPFLYMGALYGVGAGLFLAWLVLALTGLAECGGS